MVASVINIAPEGNLSRYLQDIRKFPMLAPEEELDLSRRWRDAGDSAAARATARTRTPPISSSPRTFASSPRSPWVIAVTVSRSAS